MSIKYSENGFWIQQDGNEYIIGLAEKGQDDLGAVAFVELANTQAIAVGETLMSVEAAKAVTDLLSPISGTVVVWHAEVENHPDYLNDTNAAHNWIVRLTDVPSEQFKALSDQPFPCEKN